MDGFLNILKPPGPSSFQVVNKIKNIVGAKKVGHTGTLDPGAAGVLTVCLNRATKLSWLLVESKKTYRAEIEFGIETDTYDRHGKVLKEKPAVLKREEIVELLKKFSGPQQQIPPMYSAVKTGGKRLYELARKGISVERKKRNIEIYKLSLVDFIPPGRAIIDIECSKGTYIRTLCHDIGIMSGYGAVMSFLVRLSSGCFELKDATTMEELTEAAETGVLQELVLPVDYPLQDIEKALIQEGSLRFVLNGNPIMPHNFKTDIECFKHGQLLRVYYKQTLLCLGVCHKDVTPARVKMKCMLVDNNMPGNIK